MRQPEGPLEIKKRIFVSFKFLLSLFGVFFTAFLIDIVPLFRIFKIVFSAGQVSTEKTAIGFGRSMDYLFAQSARPLSYLMPASTHPFFGQFTQKMFGSIFYGRGATEQTLYLGWVSLLLAYIAFRSWRSMRLNPAKNLKFLSSEENFLIGFFIFSAWAAFFFSLPPVVDLGLFKFYLPSYFVYQILPMFRAYARFGIIVSLCVSILAGYGLKVILGKIKTKTMQGFVFAFILLAVMFEFTNIPPTRVTDLTKMPKVYAWLKEQPGDLIIAEYPMIKFSPGEAWTNYDYLYYQTKHEKRLVNGASVGTKAFEIKKKILKVEDKTTPAILKALGTKYVILHTDLYKKGASKDVVEVIGEAPSLDKIEGYRFLKAFGPDLVYEIVANPLGLDAILQDKN